MNNNDELKILVEILTIMNQEFSRDANGKRIMPNKYIEKLIHKLYTPKHKESSIDG